MARNANRRMAPKTVMPIAQFRHVLSEISSFGASARGGFGPAFAFGGLAADAFCGTSVGAACAFGLAATFFFFAIQTNAGHHSAAGLPLLPYFINLILP